ncbi:MAG: M10 family metallopeptidase C-terminal domain-containing protein [Proteobacteria bacterium]|nr:M10 family metallopeptidase C-terminal domain-containing protein [Pseudomonadota bacterium]
MAFIIGAPYNGTGLLAALDDDDVYLLPAGIVARSTNNTAVIATGDNNQLTVEGALYGSGYAVDLGFFGTIDNRLTIAASGIVASTASTAVDVDSGQATIINAGLIAGTTVGIGFYAGTGTGSSIVNSGRILSGTYTIYHGGEENLSLTNTGTITSYGYSSYQSASVIAIDVVTNKGTMNGSVYLGSGADTYDGRTTGRVVGDVYGGADADKLYGGNAADKLHGDEGADFIYGGLGADHLWGGVDSDMDVFDYNAVTESGTTAATRDVIYDFVKGQDKIDLFTIDANTGASGNQAFGLLAKGTPTSAVGTGKIGWYQAGGDTFLRINNDKDTAIEMTIQIKGLINLSTTDFIL